MRDKFRAEGFDDVRLEKTPDGSFAVVGSRAVADPDAPTVLLYAHYDVQPPLDDAAWRTPPFELHEVDGRWYGRGTADCKGNILMHLVALRALGDALPVNLRLVVEGSEEQGTGGLEAFVASNPELFRADAILVCDTGNAAVGRPAVTVSLRGMVNVVVSVDALASEVHSGMFGGPAPDALAALVAMLASLRDAEGNTVIPGLDHSGSWSGEPYPPEQFRSDAGLLDGVRLIGDGTVSDMLWARPALTILGIDCPQVLGSSAALVPKSAARLNLRVPPGMDPVVARDALAAHLVAAAPWGIHVRRQDRSHRIAVPRRDYRPRLPGHGYRDGGSVRGPHDDPGTGWLDPALQRLRRHISRRGDHPHGRRRAPGAHPRAQRERRSEGDRALRVG